MRAAIERRRHPGGQPLDHVVGFPATVGQEWRFHFRAGESRHVVIRGLRFFSGETEIFPPFVPVLD